MLRALEMFGFVREHRFTRAHMSEYIDGELTVHDKRRLERHARRCPGCRRLLVSLQRTVQALASIRDRPAGDIADRVILRLHNEP